VAWVLIFVRTEEFGEWCVEVCLCGEMADLTGFEDGSTSDGDGGFRHFEEGMFGW
jgi:hypothetical protein